MSITTDIVTVLYGDRKELDRLMSSCFGVGNSMIALSIKQFIQKAQKIHGNLYGYAKSEYRNEISKVTIACPKHGDFLQTPAAHLKGQGCPLCGCEKNSNSKTKTQEQFLERAKTIHRNIYEYSKTLYVRSCQKITITCPKHGDFRQRASAHLGGQGCPKCGEMKAEQNQHRITKDEFIRRAMDFHGNKYDYTQAIVINYKNPVLIVCPEHGEFRQNIGIHLNGGNCPKCAMNYLRIKITKTTSDFIELAIKRHGHKYDYSRADYVHSHKKVIIGCPKHGDFLQTPGHHLEGSECPSCAKESSIAKQSYTISEYIEKAREVHGDKYDYSKTIYKNSESKITVTCSKHGDFRQKAGTHLEGQGCPFCQKSKGELEIAAWLDIKGIKYKPQASFPDCRGKKYPLRFDFYLPEHNMCIEYDGPQHHSVCTFFMEDIDLAKKKFEETQMYDNIKTQYCIAKGIPLIRLDRHKIKRGLDTIFSRHLKEYNNVY